uniref:SH3 domain-containing kinase-binding protein 1-like isoform X2 n=1 Tax=Scatophagus argus TaxID=75038 RepID=UPI001ED7F1FC|nr:SH3 domain-containing kinase-binding protein 1-like isoform X2 [Scatophagus argus]
MYITYQMSQTRLNLQVNLMMEEKRKENQREELNSSTQETSQNGPAPPALSAVLHPTPPTVLNPDPPRSRDPAKQTSLNLEQLQTELRDLRDQLDQMKSQHNKEIKLLMNELDEEKRIRLTLQMEIQRMKKHMSK